MLYGMSLLYGLAGTHQLRGDRAAPRARRAAPTAVLLAVVLCLAGFGYKIAAVPFHMWCPDVYEGAPTPVTAFLSVGPKAAGFAAAASASSPARCRAELGTGARRPPWPLLFGAPRRGDHDARQPGGAGADQRQAPARLLVDRPRRLPAAGARRRRPRRRARHPVLPRHLPVHEPRRLPGRDRGRRARRRRRARRLPRARAGARRARRRRWRSSSSR